VRLYYVVAAAKNSAIVFLPAIKRKTAPSLVVPGAVVLDYVDING